MIRLNLPQVNGSRLEQKEEEQKVEEEHEEQVESPTAPNVVGTHFLFPIQFILFRLPPLTMKSRGKG
jgi:hypothetical protein